MTPFDWIIYSTSTASGNLLKTTTDVVVMCGMRNAPAIGEEHSKYRETGISRYSVQYLRKQSLAYECVENSQFRTYNIIIIIAMTMFMVLSS